MLIFAVDDERPMLAELHDAIAEAEPGAEIQDFKSAAELLSAIQAGKRPDVVFSDIELPGMNGLSLAVRIKAVAPEAKIVFVTGFSQYALEAYRRHVNGYLMKPVEASMIREELDALQLSTPRAPEPTSANKLQVQCFGHFEVFYQGKPIIFQRKQSKELLAFLVDRQGRACTAEEIAAALWEEDADTATMKTRIRRIVSDLRSTLSEIGMEKLIVREHREIAIRRDMVDCDYYRMLEGDMQAINAFRGQYMSEYSWAEITAGYLAFR